MEGKRVVRPSRAHLLPLERVLTESSVWKEMDIARQSQLYSLLDHPSQAAVISCLDAQELPFLSRNGGLPGGGGGGGGGGGLSLFIHRNRPTVFVHLRARLVGIEEREKKVIWLVDDGTGVIAVHHTYKPLLPPLTSSSRHTLEPHIRSSKSKGKQREADEVTKEERCAIPSQYRPPPPPPPARQLTNGTTMISHQAESMTLEMKASIASLFQIGDLLSIVGRIEVWRWSDERLVIVDQVLQNGGYSGRNEREGYVESLEDANEEPRHLLRAIFLSATEYSNAFEIPALEHPTSRRTERRIREMADDGPNIPINVSVGGQQAQQQQQQRADTKKQLPIIEKRKALRVMNDIPDDYSSRPKRKGKLGVCRSIVAESDAVEKLKMKVTTMPPPPPPPPKQREQLPERRTEQESTITILPRRRRQMRRFTKLSDSQMTESTFRVYVEAHIVEACSGRPSTVAEICSHLHTKHMADHRSIARGGTRKRRKSSGVDALIGGLGPPSFSLMYLMQVDDLREHAKRTVEVATKRREEKRRERRSSAAAALALNTSKVTTTPTASSEKVQDKMKRLYISVVQAMLLDGIIVLASTNAISLPPFDGNRQGTVAPSSDTDGFTFHRADSDTYQVVTPSLLVEPIYQIVSSSSLSSSTIPTSAQILTKMQTLDDRWRFLQEDSVRECLQSMPSFVQTEEEDQSTGAGAVHFIS